MLADNQTAQEILEFLEKEDQRYKKANFYQVIIYVFMISAFLAVSYFSYDMLKSGLNFQFLLLMFIYTLTASLSLLCSLRRKELYIDINKYSELKFINQLLSEYKAEEVVLENLPLFKAAENYYVSLPDGMQRVLPEDVPYGKDTKMQKKEYHYRQLRWKHKGFYLQEITDIKACSID